MFILGQQRKQPIPIPVEITPSNSSSNYVNLTSRREGRATFATCILCDQRFDNYSSQRMCPNCDYETRNAALHNDAFYRPNSIRSRSTNIYFPTYDRAYQSVISPALQTRVSKKVLCPNCRNLNLLSNLTNNTEFRCSACQTPIPTAYLYKTSN